MCEPAQGAGTTIETPSHSKAQLPATPAPAANHAAVQLTFWERISPGEPSRSAQAEKGLPPAPPAALRLDLDQLFTRVFRRLRFHHPEPRFKASFRRFTGLRSTIAFRDKVKIEAQISDLFEEASPLVVEAIAEILITRLFGRRPSREARDCYKAWANSPVVVRRVEEIHRQRGRKRLRPPEGRYFNLAQIFDELNCRFFEGRVAATRIGWSLNRSRRSLGHYDSSHHTITITRWLDARRTPRYVVEYLVFHEMLHARYPVERNHHRRIVHSKAFQAAERAFPHYQRAVRWLGGQGSSKSKFGLERYLIDVGQPVIPSPAVHFGPARNLPLCDT